jgi:hypothetical protein
MSITFIVTLYCPGFDGEGLKKTAINPTWPSPTERGGVNSVFPYTKSNNPTSHKMVMRLACIQGYRVRTVTLGLSITTQFMVVFRSPLGLIVRWHLQTGH